ncbi:hypothetical protein BABINDRAFT_39205 [Babjeviella inositovora NRRL Y-12698]|uniref:phosphoadenylyl-sulfate reductase (thioredoxin) n=1 Tax=Babjeviella inositovora NRRL Y-12698 TaxID=984486 RepID=A0A1E3QL93_9ASCO|nr:uncharacterized protein BABINDRAFT_39205 [Babjeviella inositovora NRRL Y-12698]ODQ78420.1 hypothetical protein BABINDRAFT_39205 [Babjeviella inositovora NRRL Y-12698]
MTSSKPAPTPAGSGEAAPSVVVSPEQLAHWNTVLADLTPQEVLKWAMITFPNLYQTTAFGLTGLATVDMVSKLKKSPADTKHPIDLIFIDTLHHFPQTLDLVDKLCEKYGLSTEADLHIYKPARVNTELEFAEQHGDSLWETNDTFYDFLVKVEPSQRAYAELNVSAVLTGRRKSQGGARGALPVVELEEISGIIKINPLHNWTFGEVKQYVTENQVPYNELLDLGYRSVGDYHSTEPVREGEDERAGRWKGKSKTECGIHEASKFSQFLKEQAEGKAQQQAA